MATIDRNMPTAIEDIDIFLNKVNFELPQGFIEFYKEANGAIIIIDDEYKVLWPLTELFKLNEDYNVAIYAPDFFIFGSNGGDTAYAIERKTGYIFEMPFIGMCKDESVFKSKSLNGFIEIQ
jgi:hypothetical protein